jgi:hypothetical protein
MGSFEEKIFAIEPETRRKLSTEAREHHELG